MWKPFKENSKPHKLDEVFVKTIYGQIFYAIYMGDNNFNVHRQTWETKSLSWATHTERTIIEWMYLSEVIGILEK